MKKSIRGMLAVAVIASSVVWTACSTNWISEAEQIVAALIPATANLMTLVATLQGKSVSAADLQTIQGAGAQAGADLQLLASLIAQYQQADASTKPGLLHQIQIAMGDAQANLNGLLPALHIKDAATQAKVSAVVGLLISEVQSMAAIVPLVNSSSSPAMVAMAAKPGKKQAPLSASQFVSSFDATMTAKTGNVDLDRASAGLRIHAHSKFVRWASAGLAK